MADVGGELPAACFSSLCGGDVLHQQRRTAAFDMAAGEVDGHAVQLHRAFRTLPVQKAEQRFVAADGNHRLSNRVIGDAEHCPRRVVHRQHMPLLVEDDEALLHAAEDGIQLMPLGGQGRHLVGNAGVLLRHPAKHGRKLLVNVAFQRLVKVDLVHGGGKALRQRAGKRHRRAEAKHRAQQQIPQ